MRKKKFLIGGIIIAIAIGLLSYRAMQGAATYYYTVTEVIQQANTLRGQNIRVAGQVVSGSVEQPTSSKTVNFVLSDTTNAANTVSVTYQGALPDAFKEGYDAVAEGKLGADSIFQATSIIVKCPSRYVPQT